MTGIAVASASNAAYAIDILVATDLFLGFRINAFGSLAWSSPSSALATTPMKFFWVIAGAISIYQLLLKWIAPILIYFDWVCRIKLFAMNMWAIFSSISGDGVLSLSFDWTSINGSFMWVPLVAQLSSIGGVILKYWIILPIMWLNNILGTRPSADLSAQEKYKAGEPANMVPIYAIGFMVSFMGLAGCAFHVAFFHGGEIWRTWKRIVDDPDEDIHTKMMKVYPEVPQLWYAVFYVLMAALSCVIWEHYGTQLPRYDLLLALFIGCVLTLPIGVMNAITGYGPNLNVITESICGYMLPVKPIANRTFKCYVIWGALLGSISNYMTMILIINANRSYLDNTSFDSNGLWTGNRVQIFWGSGLIYGALSPAKIFALDGKYWFVYIIFLIGFIVPAIQWILSKKFPRIPWAKLNISIVASGINAFPNGYSVGVVSTLITLLVLQVYIHGYHKN
ncbi:hypothetical protein BGX23_000801 [Mortierella sp. AD031]|nr:hypothetical protein BGX23_000801 [Mortierella sp. AD031]